MVKLRGPILHREIFRFFFKNSMLLCMILWFLYASMLKYTGSWYLIELQCSICEIILHCYKRRLIFNMGISGEKLSKSFIQVFFTILSRNFIHGSLKLIYYGYAIVSQMGDEAHGPLLLSFRRLLTLRWVIIVTYNLLVVMNYIKH